MHYEAFFKKKQLLAQRDELLEAIGQELFEAKELPPAFATLPKEFQTFDILVRQLKERYRTLKEERDRSVLTLQDYITERNQAEKALLKELKPVRQDCDELQLKNQFSKDTKKSEAACKEISDRLNDAQTHRETLESKLARVRGKCHEKIEPLREHIIDLERTIRDVLDEEERLSYERKKRLRDLGYHFRTCPPNNESLASKYAKMKLLRIELAEFQHSEKRTRNDHSIKPQAIKKSRTGEGWMVPMLILAAAVVLGFFFRTKFEEYDIAFSNIANHYLIDDVTDSLYVNLSQIPATRISKLLPDLKSLPGGNVGFTNLDTADLLDLLIAHDRDGSLLYCGMRFRTPPTRFNLRLIQEGWDYQTSVLSRKVLQKENWLWINLNEKAYLLVPAEKAKRLESLPIINYPETFTYRGAIKPFDNNKPLLQGYDRLHMQIANNGFRIQLRASQRLGDINQRKDLLASRGVAEEFNIRYQGQELHLDGTLDILPQNLEMEQLKAFIAEKVQPRKAVRDRFRLTEITNLQPGVKTETLSVFQGDTHEPTFLSQVPVNSGIVESHYQTQTNGLLLLTEDSLARYRIHDSILDFDCRTDFQGLSLEGGTEIKDFKALQLVPTPDGSFGVILESERRGLLRNREPRMLLADLQDVNVYGIETLAGDVAATLNGAWDRDGETLFIGCRPRKRRGENRQAVIVYQRHGRNLSFQRILELPIRRDRFHITDLWHDSYRNHLYLAIWPQERAVRFDLNNTSSTAQRLSLRQSLTEESRTTMPRSGMVPNRTGDRLLMVGSQIEDVNGSHDLNLLDVSEGKMTLIDTLDPGLRISRIWRQPLTDRFWVLSEIDQQILIVQIQNDRLEGKTLIPIHGNKPAHISSDPLGRHIFVIGSSD